jgi:hypothetical protein
LDPLEHILVGKSARFYRNRIQIAQARIDDLKPLPSAGVHSSGPFDGFGARHSRGQIFCRVSCRQKKPTPILCLILRSWRHAENDLCQIV